MAAGPASQCAPPHCMWGDLGAIYSSSSLLADLGVIAMVVGLLLACGAMPARVRWIGWVLVPLLIAAGIIEMRSPRG